MFCSVIIPTIGRDTLSRAVQSVLEQGFDKDEVEIIVVNDSGERLSHRAWLESPVVRVVETNRRERCTARNTGAAIARGSYLLFLDDDDWLLPGALEALQDLAHGSEAAWLYGGYQLVDEQQGEINTFQPNEAGNCFIRFLAGEWLPLQSSLIDSETFFSVGGFASLESLLGGDEDVDLARQISLKFDIDGTSSPVAGIRINRFESTTDYENLRYQSRISREKALDCPGAFSRMRTSAAARNSEDSYWYGRIIWIYLTSVIWNLQHRKLFTAISRLCHGAAAFFSAGSCLFSSQFWYAATRPHNARNGWLTNPSR